MAGANTAHTASAPGEEPPPAVPDDGPCGAGPLTGAGPLGEPAETAEFGDPATAEVRLPNRPESARTARRLVRSVLLNRWGLSEALAEDTVLLVSELVGNAVRHTGAQSLGLRLRLRRGRIRVEVRDPSRGLPCLLPVHEFDVSGRGLFLVDHLSDRWGVDLLPLGKTTWFELRDEER
ncbi:ATP-binding protein [Streptomyces chitinivorans]|uniref:ATP-binding protein n=1 Tax=Streptomyces chitinivorans TaxID=1257027 RepID=A0ABW7HLZ0_9ACTN|nr:ATP-binding protein [Streptomyces chitinivorans]MDH2408035.1 ATP-binding protein [Streptomyces chitinivorans]